MSEELELSTNMKRKHQFLFCIYLCPYFTFVEGNKSEQLLSLLVFAQFHRRLSENIFFCQNSRRYDNQGEHIWLTIHSTSFRAFQSNTHSKPQQSSVLISLHCSSLEQVARNNKIVMTTHFK